MASSADAIKAGEAFVELIADDSKFNQSIKRASERFIKFTELVKSAGTENIFAFKNLGGLISGIGTGIKGIAGTLSSIAKVSALIGSTVVAGFATASVATLRYASSLDLASERMSTSVESVSRLAYAAKQNGIEFADLEDATKQLNQQTLAAVNGSEEQAAAFRKLGISAKTFIGLNVDDKFAAIAETLDSLNDPLDRSRFLVALFGENSSKVLPLLKKGAEGIRKLAKESDDLGNTLNGVDARKSTESIKAFDKALTSLKSLGIEVGFAILELAGDIEEIQRVALVYLKMARDWAKQNRELVATIAIVAVVVTGVGVALFAFAFVLGTVGAAISGVIAGGTALVAVIGAIGAPALVVIAIIGVLVALLSALAIKFFRSTELGQRLVETLKRSFAGLGETFRIAFGGIVDSIKNGNIENAWTIITVTMEIAWLKLINSMKAVWFDFSLYIVDTIAGAVALIRGFFAKMLSEVKVFGLKAIDFIATQAIQLFSGLGIDALKEAIDNVKKFSDLARKQIDIETKAQIKVERDLGRQSEDFIADFIRQNREALIRGDMKIEQLNELLRKLAEAGKIPQKAPEPGGLPVAPMPRAKGEIDRNLSRFGDSVKGLFDSADFRGVLGLGEANSYAKQAVDIQKNMLAELVGIRAEINGAVFT